MNLSDPNLPLEWHSWWQPAAVLAGFAFAAYFAARGWYIESVLLAGFGIVGLAARAYLVSHGPIEKPGLLK